MFLPGRWRYYGSDHLDLTTREALSMDKRSIDNKTNIFTASEDIITIFHIHFVREL